MYSLLQKKPTVQTDPYPHVIIEEALPWDLYEELEKTFPEEQVMNTIPFDKGICYRMKSGILINPTFQPEIWRKFSEYHTSAEWFMEVYELFKPWLSTIPKLSQLVTNNAGKPILENNICARPWAGFKEKKMNGKLINLLTDCQVVIHKPITDELINSLKNPPDHKTTRTPHIDNPLELFAGLLYMPYKDDTSTGGDFQLHTVKNDIIRVNMKGGRAIYPEDVGPVHTTVPYKRNTFVMFLNINSNTVHSVSIRNNPTMYRRSVNIIAEFRKKNSVYHKMYEVDEI